MANVLIVTMMRRVTSVTPNKSFRGCIAGDGPSFGLEVFGRSNDSELLFDMAAIYALAKPRGQSIASAQSVGKYKVIE